MSVTEDMVKRAVNEYAKGWRAGAVDERMRVALESAVPDVRRAIADEVEAALGDFERLPPKVAERMTALIHRLRIGRDG